MVTTPLWLSPNIVLSQSDHRQLSVLALAGTNHTADIADDLLHELDRASVVADAAVPGDIVRMGSLVRFRTGRDVRSVTLVYPAEADIASARVSVLTPVGTALIGLRTGQSITFRTRDGRPQMLTVLNVVPPGEGRGAAPSVAWRRHLPHACGVGEDPTAGFAESGQTELGTPFACRNNQQTQAVTVSQSGEPTFMAATEIMVNRV